MLTCAHCNARFVATADLERAWYDVHLRRFHEVTRATASVAVDAAERAPADAAALPQFAALAAAGLRTA